MSKLSFSPYYYQGIIWVAELLDGTVLKEWNEQGKETPFKDIPKDKLKRFYLIGENANYFFDCQTGIFYIDGRQFVFPLSGLPLNYGEGLIHFKEASDEVKTKKFNYDGFSINGYQIGWKVTSDKIKSQVIFSIPQKIFYIEVTFLDIYKTAKWSVKV